MTNRNRARLSKLSLGLAIALAAAPAFAQNTTAAVGGRILSGDDQPVAGAQVTILHAPSGTVSNAVSGADGRYAAVSFSTTPAALATSSTSARLLANRPTVTTPGH